MTPLAQREALGEALYPRIATVVGAQLAAKVTGMLLHMGQVDLVRDNEIDVGALLALLDDPSLLKARAHEACGQLVI